MPIYEYRCNNCRRKVAIYVRNFSASPECPHCRSENLSRLFSTFAIRGTYMDVYEDILSDHQLTTRLMRNDPSALAEWNRRMSRGMEDDTIGPEYEDMLEKMEHGEMPQMPSGEMPEEDSE